MKSRQELRADASEAAQRELADDWNVCGLSGALCAWCDAQLVGTEADDEDSFRGFYPY